MHSSKTLKIITPAIKTALIAGSTGAFFYTLGMGIGALTDPRNRKKLPAEYPFEHEKLSRAVPFDVPMTESKESGVIASLIDELEGSIIETSLPKLKSAIKKAEDANLAKQVLSFVNRYNRSVFSPYREYAGLFYPDDESEFVSTLLDACIRHEVDVFKINPTFIKKVAKIWWSDQYQWETRETIIWNNVIREKLIDLAIATGSMTEALENNILSEAVRFPYTSAYIANFSDAKDEEERKRVVAVKTRNIEVIIKALTHMNAAHQDQFNKAMRYAIAQSFVLTRTQRTAPPRDLTIFNLLCKRTPEGIDLRKALVFSLDHCHVYEVAELYVNKLKEVAKNQNVSPLTWKELAAIIKLQNSGVLPALANILREHNKMLNYLFSELYKKDGVKSLAFNRVLVGAPNEGIDFLRNKSNEFITLFKDLILVSKTEDLAMLISTLSSEERDALHNELKSASQSNPKDLVLLTLLAIFDFEGFLPEVARCNAYLKEHGTFQNFEQNSIFTEQAKELVIMLGWTKFLADNLAAEEQQRNADKPKDPEEPKLQQMNIVSAIPTTAMMVFSPIFNRASKGFSESKSSEKAASEPKNERWLSR